MSYVTSMVHHGGTLGITRGPVGSFCRWGARPGGHRRAVRAARCVGRPPVVS